MQILLTMAGRFYALRSGCDPNTVVCGNAVKSTVTSRAMFRRQHCNSHREIGEDPQSAPVHSNKHSVLVLKHVLRDRLCRWIGPVPTLASSTPRDRFALTS